MIFHGIYSTSRDGLGSSFATEAQDSIEFPPSVMYEGEQYFFVRSFQVDTPSQGKQFDSYCSERNIETGVSIKP